MEYWDEPELISVLHTDAQLQRRAAQLSFSSSFLVAVKDFVDMRPVQHFVQLWALSICMCTI